MTNLTSVQSNFAQALAVAFREDFLTNMLSPLVTDSLAKGFAVGLPLDRIFRMYAPEKDPLELNDYLSPHMNRVWPYFPISKLLSPEFKEHTLTLVGAAVLEELKRGEVSV